MVTARRETKGKHQIVSQSLVKSQETKISEFEIRCYLIQVRMHKGVQVFLSAECISDTNLKLLLLIRISFLPIWPLFDVEGLWMQNSIEIL